MTVVKIKKEPREKNAEERALDSQELFSAAIHMEHVSNDFCEHVVTYEGDYFMTEWSKLRDAQLELSAACTRLKQEKVCYQWGEGDSATHINHYEKAIDD
jgi:hypothetical protein